MEASSLRSKEFLCQSLEVFLAKFVRFLTTLELTFSKTFQDEKNNHITLMFPQKKIEFYRSWIISLIWVLKKKLAFLEVHIEMNLHFVFIQYEMGECVRAGFCNFMHLKPISRDLRRELYSRGARFRSRSRTPLRDRDRNGSSGGRSKRRSSRSPKRRKHWNWNYNKCCQTASFAVMLNIESVSCVE